MGRYSVYGKRPYKRFVKLLKYLRLKIRVHGSSKYIIQSTKYKAGVIHVWLVNLATFYFGNSNQREWVARELMNETIHDVGHFIVAPRYRKRAVDFGLSTKSSLVNRSVAINEEEKARIVERFLVRWIHGSSLKMDRKTESLWLGSFTKHPAAIGWWQSEGRELVTKLLRRIDTLASVPRWHEIIS